MIAVSDSFKKAIKSDNREIYGYVDIVYDKKDGEYEVSEIPTISPLSKQDGSDLIDDIKIMKNYATLENNYFSLDGSFILANKNSLGNSGGYISDDIYSNIEDTTITLVSSETGYVSTKGFTIFFKDNIPFNFDINILTEYGQTSEEDQYINIEVRNNQSYNYQYIFDNEITIKEFSITIFSIDRSDRRIRISDISFSLTNIYDGNELISFEVNEESNLLGESLPINTCTVNLNNYPDENNNIKFDPINPNSITQYLTENASMKLYIGTLTEENGIEYVKMGDFYLKNWSSDANGNVTLNGEDLISKLKDTTISSDGTFLRTLRTYGELSTYFTNMTGYNIFLGSSGVASEELLRDNNFGNWLQAHIPIMLSTSTNKLITFYTSRNNDFLRKEISDNSIDNISRHELINDVNYKTKTMINKVEITDVIQDSGLPHGKEDVIVDAHVLQSTEEYVWYSLDEFVYHVNSVFSYTNNGHGTATLIDKNDYMIYVKYEGNVGDIVTITYNGSLYDDFPNKTWTFTNDIKNGETLSLDFTNYFDFVDSDLPVVADYYLTKDTKYIVTANTMGDPSIELGDKISIQTRYNSENDGYKDIVITKQKFTYDGGLQCQLEGRGN